MGEEDAPGDIGVEDDRVGIKPAVNGMLVIISQLTLSAKYTHAIHSARSSSGLASSATTNDRR